MRPADSSAVKSKEKRGHGLWRCSAGRIQYHPVIRVKIEEEEDEEEKKARGQLKCTKDHESVGMHCRVEHVAHIFESEFTTSIGGLARPYVQQQNMSSSFSTTATLSLSPFISGKKRFGPRPNLFVFGADIHVLNRFSYMLSNCHIYRRKKGKQI